MDKELFDETYIIEEEPNRSRVEANNDYVNEYGATAYYNIFYRAIEKKDSSAVNLLSKLKMKNNFENEVEKSWTILMVMERYGGAANIIDWTNHRIDWTNNLRLINQTKMVTQLKRSIYNTIIMTKGEGTWKLSDESISKILSTPNPNSSFDQQIETELNDLKDQNLIKKYKEELTTLIRLAKSSTTQNVPTFGQTLVKTIKNVFPNKYYKDGREDLTRKFHDGGIEKYVAAFLKNEQMDKLDFAIRYKNGKIEEKSGLFTDLFDFILDQRRIRACTSKKCDTSNNCGLCYQEKTKTDDDLEKYLKSELQKGNLTFKMSSLLGVGGESVVLAVDYGSGPKAFRLAYYGDQKDKNEGSELGINEQQKAAKVNEMRIGKLSHQNIMKYIDNSFEMVNEELIHITSKLFDIHKTRFICFI